MDARTSLADLLRVPLSAFFPLTADSHHCSSHLHPHKESDNKFLIMETSGHSLEALSSFTPQ